MIQLLLAFFGLSAILCTQHPNTKLRRYAPLFGVAGQPFWLWTTWHSQQWGIFVLCIAYTVLWGMGLYTHWFKKKIWTTVADMRKEKKEYFWPRFDPLEEKPPVPIYKENDPLMRTDADGNYKP